MRIFRTNLFPVRFYQFPNYAMHFNMDTCIFERSKEVSGFNMAHDSTEYSAECVPTNISIKSGTTDDTGIESSSLAASPTVPAILETTSSSHFTKLPIISSPVNNFEPPPIPPKSSNKSKLDNHGILLPTFVTGTRPCIMKSFGQNISNRSRNQSFSSNRKHLPFDNNFERSVNNFRNTKIPIHPRVDLLSDFDSGAFFDSKNSYPSDADITVFESSLRSAVPISKNDLRLCQDDSVKPPSTKSGDLSTRTCCNGFKWLSHTINRLFRTCNQDRAKKSIISEKDVRSCDGSTRFDSSLSGTRGQNQLKSQNQENNRICTSANRYFSYSDRKPTGTTCSFPTLCRSFPRCAISPDLHVSTSFTDSRYQAAIDREEIHTNHILENKPYSTRIRSMKKGNTHMQSQDSRNISNRNLIYGSDLPDINKFSPNYSSRRTNCCSSRVLDGKDVNPSISFTETHGDATVIKSPSRCGVVSHSQPRTSFSPEAHVKGVKHDESIQHTSQAQCDCSNNGNHYTTQFTPSVCQNICQCSLHDEQLKSRLASATFSNREMENHRHSPTTADDDTGRIRQIHHIHHHVHHFYCHHNRGSSSELQEPTCFSTPQHTVDSEFRTDSSAPTLTPIRESENCSYRTGSSLRNQTTHRPPSSRSIQPTLSRQSNTASPFRCSSTCSEMRFPCSPPSSSRRIRRPTVRPPTTDSSTSASSSLNTDRLPSGSGTSSGTSSPADSVNTSQLPESSFHQSMKELRKMGWYWGPLAITEAQTLLAKRPDGTFLVRDSGHDTYILSLSFRVRGETYHTRIEHSQGRFSFWSQPQTHSASTMVEFVEKAVAHSISGQYHYFLQSNAQDGPPVEVPLLYPLSRFQAVPSLQHLARFTLLSHCRRDHIDRLDLPPRLLDYLREKQYFVESLDAFEEAVKGRPPLTFQPRRPTATSDS